MKLLDLRGCFSGFQNLILQVSTFNFVIAHVKLRSIWKKIMNGSNLSNKKSGYFILLHSVARRLLPKRFSDARSRAAEARQHRRYSNLPVDRVFSEIYQNKEWGSDEGRYYSGTGSHDPVIVAPYVQVVKAFLASFPDKPVLVDLGSGDFNVGRQFVDFAQHYYACDIVAELQEHNRNCFDFPNVEFLSLNAVEDSLPDGDIIFIRQVFQHLSNTHIQQVLEKCRKYPYWVITEHLPDTPGFQPNADITAGCGIRVLFNSGVVLTAPPFNVTGFTVRLLCEVPEEYGGVIRTLLFERDALSTE